MDPASPLLQISPEVQERLLTESMSKMPVFGEVAGVAIVVVALVMIANVAVQILQLRAANSMNRDMVKALVNVYASLEGLRADIRNFDLEDANADKIAERLIVLAERRGGISVHERG